MGSSFRAWSVDGNKLRSRDGHPEEKGDPLLYTEINSADGDVLDRFVEEVKAKSVRRVM